MRLLFLGDMVGKTGRTAVWDRLPGLVSDLKLDFVIVNGENAAGGFGITVNDLYLTENAIYFDTTLLGPSPDSEAPASDTASYPYLVIKTEYIDEPVVFK